MRRSSVSLRVAVAGVLLLTALLSGCASTQVKDVWKDEVRHGKPAKMLVIAVVGNATVQRTFEGLFARELKEKGILAVESFRVMPDGLKTEGDGGQAAIAEAVKQQGADAVLITRVTGRFSSVSEIPGMTIMTGHGYGYGGYAAVVASFPDPHGPTTQGYTHERKFLVLETHIIDARSEKPIWAVRTQTRLTGPPQQEIEPYVTLVARTLFHEGPW